MLQALGTPTPSPEPDGTRLGIVAGTWPTQHVARAAGRAPPQSPSRPRTNGPQLGQLQARALPPGRAPKQADQALHSKRVALPSSAGGQGRQEPRGWWRKGRSFRNQVPSPV